MPVADESGDWVSGKEAAAIVGVSAATIWRAARDGRIGYRPSPLGGAWKYNRRDVDRLARSRRSLEDRVTDLETWRATHEHGHPDRGGPTNGGSDD